MENVINAAKISGALSIPAIIGWIINAVQIAMVASVVILFIAAAVAVMISLVTVVNVFKKKDQEIRMKYHTASDKRLKAMILANPSEASRYIEVAPSSSAVVAKAV